jgi:hypothetical protein
MLILKNSHGITTAFNHRRAGQDTYNTLSGSSLNRKNTSLMTTSRAARKKEQKNELKKVSMSQRTKNKIRKKILAFSQLHKRLTFTTLTFVNKINDRLAVKILHEFLDNVGKHGRDFQYIWVAERQMKNKIFEQNIHFHIISTKYWNISRWWKYWIELQKKHDVISRQSHFNPSSAFDVKQVNTANIRGIVRYLTKYVTKNNSQFECQVWNCSKKISRLYTDEYTDLSFLRNVKYLEESDQLGGKVKMIATQYANIHYIPLNRKTMPLYARIDKKNQEIWHKHPL